MQSLGQIRTRVTLSSAHQLFCSFLSCEVPCMATSLSRHSPQIYMYDRGTFRVYLPPWVLFTIYIYNLNNLNNLNNLTNLNPAHLNYLNYLLYKSGQRI